MIKKVKIENFKSVRNLELELGRLNVLIGENGCGKTNILEAVAIGSAAVENKIDNEFLRARGIRITEPELMKSAFKERVSSENITVAFYNNQDNGVKINLLHEKGFWTTQFSIDDRNFTVHKGALDLTGVLYEFLQKNTDTKEPSLLAIKEFYQIRSILSKELFPFLIYAPENSGLRQFQEEGQVLPLGIGGEGLFKHLVTLSKEQPEIFVKIKNQLKIIDWFEDLQIPGDLMFTERRLNIKDRFLHPDLQYIDQRSANEGFLYLLFYFTLFISESTPRFFAIDNIDNALNPKLCVKLIQTLSKLAKEHDKQAVITTHNPSVLDGLDLSDDDQRLFVVYRNADGYTVAKRVQPKAPVNGTENIRLSEAFIRGYLGGLPKNF